MFHEVVAKCRNKGITSIKDFAQDSDMSLRATKYWLQHLGISWDSIRHSIAYLDLLEEGWWENSYPLHPDEPLVKYHKLYCSAWGVILKKESKLQLNKRFYRYVEIGFYKPPYIKVSFRDRGAILPRVEFLHNIIAKCFLGMTSDQRVKFKNKNSYDCHIWNLELIDKCGVEEEEEPPQVDILDKWDCKQCNTCITNPEELYFKHETLFCSENCADIFEEDLKFVKVSVDMEDTDWYNTFEDY